MDARWRRRIVRRGLRALRRAIRALGDAGQALAERLAYRPREVVVVAALAAGLFGGLAIERWRAGHPVVAERLEAEPARPTSPPPTAVPAAFRSRPRSVAPRCDEPDARPAPAPEPTTAGTAPRLDLNRATPGELARVARISWRLAARIVAAREAFERDPPAAAPPDGDAAAMPPAEPDADPPPRAPDGDRP
jgi:hypothetical protein